MPQQIAGVTQPPQKIPRKTSKTILILQLVIIVSFSAIAFSSGINTPVEDIGGAQILGILLMGAGLITAVFTFFYETSVLLRYKHQKVKNLYLSLLNLVIALAIVALFIVYG